MFNKSLTEHRNADTLKKLHDTEKIIKDKKEKEYISMDLSNQEKVTPYAHDSVLEAGASQVLKLQRSPHAHEFVLEAGASQALELQRSPCARDFVLKLVQARLKGHKGPKNVDGLCKPQV